MSDPGPPTPEPDPGSAPLPAGTTIAGRYRVESPLGQGAMGEVYLVEHLGLRKRMALKLLRPELLAVPSVLDRFQREAVAAAHLDHPHVAAAHDYGQTEDGRWFLALEYVEGRELRQELTRAAGPFPPARALFIARQIVGALVRSHGLGLVHRDLKPENIMLVQRDGQEDYVKILDFGLARASGPLAKKKEEAGAAEQDAASLKLTQLGEVIGTPAYMAPEQAFGGVADIRSDLYSVGVLLYEMLTGVRPFKGTASLVLIYQALTEDAPPMAVRVPGVSLPSGVEELVLRLLAKKPEDRIQTPTELLAAMEELIAKHGLTWPADPAAQNARPLPTGMSWISESLGRVGQLGKLAAGAWSGIKSLLARVRALLPAPMRRIPLPVIFAVPALVLALFIARALWSVDPSHPPAAPNPPGAASAGPQPAMAPQPLYDSAVAQGTDALLAIDRQYPADPRIKRALVVTYTNQRRHVEAVQALAQLVPLDPALFQSEEIMKALMAALQGPPDAAQAGVSLLEQLGEGGVDLLYDLSAKGGRARWKTRLQQSLGKPEVIARASVATRYALELRAAKSCEAKRTLLPRAAQEGDQRALSQLKALLQQSGCGFMGDEDCWPCLRKSSALQDAIAALEAR